MRVRIRVAGFPVHRAGLQLVYGVDKDAYANIYYCSNADMFPVTLATGPNTGPYIGVTARRKFVKLSKPPFRRASPPTPLTGCDQRRPSSLLFFFRRPECSDFGEPFPRVLLHRTATLCVGAIFCVTVSWANIASGRFRIASVEEQPPFMQPVSVVVSGNGTLVVFIIYIVHFFLFTGRHLCAK